MTEEEIMNEIVCMVQDYSAQKGIHWLDIIEYIKEMLLSERATTHKTSNNISNNPNEIVSPNRYLDKGK